jgi:hypothetical protein
MDKKDDEFDALLSSIFWRKSPWSPVFADGKLMAVLPDVPNYKPGSPERLAQEAEWEAKIMALHAEQESAAPLELESKDRENVLAARQRKIRRGD